MRGLAALLLLATPTLAQDFQAYPTLARVAGVAASDVLNVRAAPSFDAQVLATLEPTETGIEVLGLSRDGGWALVPLPEGEGWVARRFLREEAQDPYELPRPASCAGTEPFWSITLGARPVLDVPGDRTLLIAVDEAASYGGRAVALEGAELGLDLTMVRGSCSDGMSDRPFGIAALLWDRGRGELLEGCCTLQAR